MSISPSTISSWYTMISLYPTSHIYKSTHHSLNFVLPNFSPSKSPFHKSSPPRRRNPIPPLSRGCDGRRGRGRRDIYTKRFRRGSSQSNFVTKLRSSVARLWLVVNSQRGSVGSTLLILPPWIPGTHRLENNKNVVGFKEGKSTNIHIQGM